MPTHLRPTTLLTVAQALLCLAGPPVLGAQDTTANTSRSSELRTPNDLGQALASLDSLFSAADKHWVDSVSEPDMIALHFSTGLWLRNNWGLWAGSPLATYFNGLGIRHPDDMSGIILTSYWRHRHAQPLRLDEQVKYYIDWWAKRPAPGPDH